jgi:NNP family nitrate/nitrite transporter-like MFS transporter
MTVPGKEPDTQVWYQNAAFVWIPLMVDRRRVRLGDCSSRCPIKANLRQQFDIFNNTDTWLDDVALHHDLRHLLGTVRPVRPVDEQSLRVSGNTRHRRGAAGATAQMLIDGYAVPDAGEVRLPRPARRCRLPASLFSPLTDRMGGAIWTLISGIGLVAVDRVHDSRP